ncbi:MAG TPA: NAD(P)H-binding protein [Solirubrobacterales bacterium]
MAANVLIAGATGFVGGRLAASLQGSGARIRCLVRDREKARRLEASGAELHVGDVTDARSLEGAGAGIGIAYFLVHSMAGGEGFAERERRGAAEFARMAKREGVGRVVYLGGLGEEGTSPHLRSRHEVARALSEEGPPLTYFRAAMVVGAGSESYRTLRHLVGRLPVMVAPAWLRTPTQPIGIDATVEYLRRAPDVPESAGREVQVGGPDVLAYDEMLDRMAVAMGKRRPPKLRLPLLTPWLSALWLGLVTPVDTKVARPLVEGLTTPTVVTDPSGAEPFGISPEPFDEALRRALAEEGFRKGRGG